MGRGTSTGEGSTGDDTATGSGSSSTAGTGQMGTDGTGGTEGGTTRGSGGGSSDGTGSPPESTCEDGIHDVGELCLETDPAFYPVGRVPLDWVHGDFDGDRLLDIAVLCWEDERVDLLAGRGDGTFQAARSFPGVTQGADLAAGDLNGDAIDDIVVVDSSVSIWFGSDGGFQIADEVALEGAVHAQITDSNGDAFPDVLVAIGFWSDLVPLLGSEEGEFVAGEPLGIGADPWGAASTDTALEVADLRGIGREDAVMLNGEAGQILVALSNGDGTYALGDPVEVGIGAGDVVLHDADHDGNVDLVVAGHAAGTVWLYPGQGDGTFGFPDPRGFHDGSEGRIHLHVGDFDHDDRADLLFGVQRRLFLEIWSHFAVGTSSPRVLFLPTGQFLTQPRGVDLNGDGALDVVSLSPGVEPRVVVALARP